MGKINITSIENQNKFIFLLIAIWCLGIFSEAVFQFIPNSIIVYPVVKYCYSIVCHQDPDKLLTILGHHTLTCSRCTGIYIGVFTASAAMLFRRKIFISTRILLIASIPIFFDVICSSLEIYSYSKVTAFITGFLLGSTGFFYIHSLIIELISKQDKY